MNCFAEKLQLALNRSGKTQQQLADYLNLHAGTISNYLKGKYSPKNPERIIAIANFLSVEPSWLASCEVFETKDNDSQENNIDEDTRKMLANYSKLNSLGKSKADDYIEELTEHPKYMRSDDSDNEEVIKPEDNKKVLIFKNRQR